MIPRFQMISLFSLFYISRYFSNLLPRIASIVKHFPLTNIRGGSGIQSTGGGWLIALPPQKKTHKKLTHTANNKAIQQTYQICDDHTLGFFYARPR